MYIKSIEIENIRSIEHFHWELDKADEDLAGWHVLIGNNGSGKSTILKAIALALVDAKAAEALRVNWNNWLTDDTEQGIVTLQLIRDKTRDAKYLRPCSPVTLEPSFQLQRRGEQPLCVKNSRRLRH